MFRNATLIKVCCDHSLTLSGSLSSKYIHSYALLALYEMRLVWFKMHTTCCRLNVVTLRDAALVCWIVVSGLGGVNPSDTI